MRAWFETESDALAYCSDTCDDGCEVAWLDGATIVLATIRVVRDEAGDVLQAIVERRVHASPRRIAAAAANLALVCRDERFRHVFESDKVFRAALTVLEDALRGVDATGDAEGDQEMAQVQQRAVALEAFYQRMLAIGVARKESYNVISAGEATSYGGYGAAPSNERNRATNGRWLNEPMV